MKKKKLLSILILVVGVNMVSCSLAVSFWDLPSYHWAYSTIIHLTSEGVINGYPDGSYQPESSVSRAEYLKLILSALYGDNRYFETSELKAVHWAFPYFWEAKNCGYIEEKYISGIQDMNLKITRLEMAQILAKICEENHITTNDASSTVTPVFSDMKSLSSTDRNSIQLVAKIGFIKGYPDGTFGPNRTMTRAECATIIERFLNAI